jgi:UDP-GlcNAc:undecaprenyl-phosphate/decaprenyl-phosphate GlcNAc-1-phosphate transferase
MTFVYLLSSFFVTGCFLFVLKPVAVRVGLVDLPGGRKTHLRATPLVGGLGIFLGVLVVSIFMPGVISEYQSLLSLSAIVLFIGVFDDARELGAWVRMLGHALVALAMAVVAGVQLTSLGDLVYLGPINLGAFSIPVTVFATIGVINAINMTDGIDGLSGTLVIVALGFIAFLSFGNGQIPTANFILILILSTTAFLCLNFRGFWNRRALVYLGDAGSTTLGYILAWLMIDSTQGISASFAPVYALWFLVVPLFDTIYLMIKRPLRGASPFEAGTDHIHHILLSRGYSAQWVVIILAVVSLVFGFGGLAGKSLGVSESTMFLLLLALFIFYFSFSDRILRGE